MAALGWTDIFGVSQKRIGESGGFAFRLGVQDQVFLTRGPVFRRLLAVKQLRLANAFAGHLCAPPSSDFANTRHRTLPFLRMMRSFLRKRLQLYARQTRAKVVGDVSDCYILQAFARIYVQGQAKRGAGEGQRLLIQIR